MSEIRKFRVLKDMRVYQHGTKINITIPKDTLLELLSFKLRTDCDFEIYYCVEYHFYVTDLRVMVRMGYLEEILPDKKPIILGGISTEEFTNNLKHMNNVLNEKSDSILDYEKKYNMWDATHLMKNHDIKMVDSKFGFVWEYYSESNTLWTETFDEARNDSSDCFIEDLFDGEFGYVDSLDLTFTLVKPVEKVKEKWVEIETHKDLCNAIVNKKMIRLGDGKPSNEYNDKQIETLFGALSHGIFKIEYLKE